MPVDVNTLLNRLPPYNDEWIVIKENQSVADIITEVLNAHEQFKPYYKKIALYFDGTIDEICEDLYRFCKTNIHYREESRDNQTTALPTGILTRGFGDCKHFSLFSGGILGALQDSGKKISWCYRFASYNFTNRTPHHVFIVVFDKGEEIWIDPTPKADKLEPNWIQDKRPKKNTMPLQRNISGVSDYELLLSDYDVTEYGMIGKRPFYQIVTQSGAVSEGYPVNYNIEIPRNPYFSLPFLAMTIYSHDTAYSNEGTNWETLASEINQKIATGPEPGHTVDAAFVKWIFDTNNKAWNFYYRQGVKPGYVPSNYKQGWPKPVVTPDMRMAFDIYQPVDDWNNNEIFALTAWIQALINQYDQDQAHIMTPQGVKEFSQGKFGGNDTMNMFTEMRGSSLFHDIGKALEHSLNFVKDGVIKITGSIPRNSLLGLVGINAFNFAGNLWENINLGEWDGIAKLWKKVGGNPDKLRNTIEDGKDKKAILGNADSIGEPMTIAAFLASAAPIIAILLKYLDKDGKAAEVLSATKGFLQTKYPEIDFTGYEFLDKATGKPIEWVIDPADDENQGGGNDDLPNNSNFNFMDLIKNNPIPVAAVATLGSYFFLNRNKTKKNFIIPLIIGGATYFFLSRNATPLPGTDKRLKLVQWNQNNYSESTNDPSLMARVDAAFKAMTEPEVSVVYDFVFNYLMKSIPVKAGSSLESNMIIINDKYNIFS